MGLFRTRRDTGQQAEAHAQAYLCRQGLIPVERNYHCKVGELDLIMREPTGELVFVEVRYRRHASHGGAVGSIDRHKQQRLLRAAAHYLLQRGLSQQPCRIDVLALEGELASGPNVTWLRNAIEAY